jgi:hypothetical protein
VARPKDLLPFIVADGQEPALPKLTPGEKEEIIREVEIDLSNHSWENVELARRDFVWSQWSKRKATEYRVVAERLEALADAANKASAALSGNDGRSASVTLDNDSLLLWRELNQSEQDLPPPLQIFPLLHNLRDAARRALSRTAQRPEKNAWASDWDGFIHLLASVFEHHDLKVTAAKSSQARNPRVSPFVKFAWAIMKTIPEDCRAHTHSVEAMSKAVANSLAVRRSCKSAGPITSDRSI